MAATTRMGAGNTDPIASAFFLRFLCEPGRLHCRKPGKTARTFALCFTNSHIAHPLWTGNPYHNAV